MEQFTLVNTEEAYNNKNKLSKKRINDQRSETRRNIITIFIVSLSALAYGLGLNSAIVEFQISKEFSPEIEKSTFESRFGFAVSLLLAGGALGHIIYNYFVSIKFTKKKFLLLGSIINFVSFFSIYFYPHLYFIGAARFFMGISAGFAGAIVPGVIYELAPDRARGFFGAFYPGFIVLGLFIGQVLSFYKSPVLFKIPHFILCAIFFLQTVLLFLIRLKNPSVESEDKSVMETLKSKECRKSLIISIIFHIAQHLSGIDFIALFTDEILSKTSFPYEYGIINFIIAFILTCVSGWLCDLGGRKVFFVASCAATMLSIGCMNFLNYQHIALGAFFLTYNIGLGNIPWVILGEIFPKPYAKAGIFISVLANWCAAFGITVFSKVIYDFFGYYVYSFFSLSMFFTAIFTIFNFTETKYQRSPCLQ